MNRPGLILKHKKFLNMIGWAELDPITPIVPAFAVRLTKESSPPMGLKRTYLPTYTWTMCYFLGTPNNRY